MSTAKAPAAPSGRICEKWDIFLSMYLSLFRSPYVNISQLYIPLAFTYVLVKCLNIILEKVSIFISVFKNIGPISIHLDIIHEMTYS